jgi:transglutaminase-like putative cysteine protease
MRVVPLAAAVDHLLLLVAPFEARSAAAALRREIEDRIRRWSPPGAGDTGDGRVDLAAIVNMLKHVGTTTGDPLWDSCVASGRRWVTELERDVPVRDRFRIRWRRTIAGPSRAGARADGARVRMPLVVRDRPAEAPTVTGASHAVVETRLREGGMDVFLSAPAGDDVDVEIETTVSAHRTSGEPSETTVLSAEERRLWTREKEGLVRVTPRVRALARSLGGDSEEEFLERVWDAFFLRMRSGYVHHFQIDESDPAATLLEGGWFDCYSGSALFVALCRARALPARLVSGLVLHGVVPVRHYWAEAYVGGWWRPFDLITWDLAGGRVEDRSWSHRFFGRLEPRAVFECLPRAVTGPPGFRAPRAWVHVIGATPSGVRHSFLDDRGQMAWSDEVSVSRAGD